MVNRNILKNTVWKYDHENRQIIIYEKNNIYIIPTHGFVGIQIDTSNLPSDLKKAILIGILYGMKINTNKQKKSKINEGLISKYPIILDILNITMNFNKKEFDLDDKISVFKYGKEDKIDITLREKINLIFQSYK